MEPCTFPRCLCEEPCEDAWRQFEERSGAPESVLSDESLKSFEIDIPDGVALLSIAHPRNKPAG